MACLGTEPLFNSIRAMVDSELSEALNRFGRENGMPAGCCADPPTKIWSGRSCPSIFILTAMVGPFTIKSIPPTLLRQTTEKFTELAVASRVSLRARPTARTLWNLPCSIAIQLPSILCSWSLPALHLICHTLLLSSQITHVGLSNKMSGGRP